METFALTDKEHVEAADLMMRYLVRATSMAMLLMDFQEVTADIRLGERQFFFQLNLGEIQKNQGPLQDNEGVSGA